MSASLLSSAPFEAAIGRNLAFFQDELNASATALPLLRDELPNLTRALDFAARLPQTNAAAADLLLQLYATLEQHGNCAHWAQLFICTINRYQGEPATLCQLLNKLGQLERNGGNYQKALYAHRRARQIGEEHQLPLQCADSLYLLASVYSYLNQWDAVEMHAQSALKCYRKDCDGKLEQTRRGIAFSLSVLGLNAAAQNRPAAAVQLFLEAIELLHAIRAPYQAARVHLNLGNLLLGQSDDVEAEQHYVAARTLLQDSDNIVDEALASLNLSVLYYQRQQHEHALKILESIDYHLLRKAGRYHLAGLLKNNLGNVLIKAGDLEMAAMQLEEAIDIWQHTANPVELANSIGSLGHVLKRQSRFAQAADRYRQALDQLAKCSPSVQVQQLTAEFAAGLAELD